ncbi:uncharacterized protein LY79DRAFT_319120 [Colletotrichum navitas]|uniref:Uncharacterized protein n=1 Tax=Colletotrichum navitas TaxID=681940 RepID=A0AAD8PSU3_9PEZI|nr:uncharacterized protein LY79DRAFT_319120 [Colletotrichum navitas]KAK1580081.1 hypothetical protein LY79DRAFT_319120 [Colletotrichum navitas]
MQRNRDPNIARLTPPRQPPFGPGQARCYLRSWTFRPACRVPKQGPRVLVGGKFGILPRKIPRTKSLHPTPWDSHLESGGFCGAIGRQWWGITAGQRGTIPRPMCMEERSTGWWMRGYDGQRCRFSSIVAEKATVQTTNSSCEHLFCGHTASRLTGQLGAREAIITSLQE